MALHCGEFTCSAKLYSLNEAAKLRYLIKSVLVDQTDLLAERRVQDVLVGDGDDVAHELSDAAGRSA